MLSAVPLTTRTMPSWTWNTLEGIQRLSGTAQQWLALGNCLDVLRFLRSLPKEEIGTDSRAQYGDHRGPKGSVGRKRGHKQAPCNVGPGDADHQDRTEIGEDSEAQPSQDQDVAAVLHEDLQARAQSTEQKHIDEAWPIDKQTECIAHCTKVGANVDGVCYTQ